MFGGLHPSITLIARGPLPLHYRFFFQAEDGIRDLVRSRGLGDVYKRQLQAFALQDADDLRVAERLARVFILDNLADALLDSCLLYTSDAADERSSVDLGGRRIIKKKIVVKDARAARHTT